MRWTARHRLLSAVLASGFIAPASCSGTERVAARGVVVFSEQVVGGIPARPDIDLSGPPSTCAGTGPYSDLVEGQSIVLRRADGTIVGSGQLGPGTATVRDRATGRTQRAVPQVTTTATGTVSCRIAFEIPNVDGDSDHYQVAIGDRVPLLRVRRAALRGMVLRIDE